MPVSTVSKFLIDRLSSSGVKHVFGIPGDYVVDFYSDMWKSKEIDVVNTTDEAHAGFAADAYARMNGIGAVCVTYSVGAFKLTNTVACAYAERSPLVIISGAPGMEERKEDVLLHHMVGSFNSQIDMFKNITCASEVLDDPSTAGFKIDSALEALRHYKRPIYLELPRDVAKKSISYDVYNLGTPTSPETDEENLQEAVDEVVDWINKSEKPAILAGVELGRYDFGEDLIAFAEKSNIPVATTLLSKSTVKEEHPLFAGIYSGAASIEETRKIIEDSDCLILLGVMLTDLTLCFKPSKFDKRQIVSCNLEGLRVKNHTFKNVQFADFCDSLFSSCVSKKDVPILPEPIERNYVSQGDVAITTDRVFEKINSVLEKNMAIIADVGDSMFGAGDLVVHHKNNFLSPAFYTSMGFAIPGALGASCATDDRQIVILGDGAFQMSFSEISTILEKGFNPIVFLLNNGGFSTERVNKDGDYNNLRNWEYHNFPEIFGGGKGFLVKTEKDLDDAWDFALKSKELCLLNIQLDSKDVSKGFNRMMEARKNNG